MSHSLMTKGDKELLSFQHSLRPYLYSIFIIDPPNIKLEDWQLISSVSFLHLVTNSVLT